MSLFVRYGFSNDINSDNNQLNSYAFTEFVNKNNTTLRFSSPHFHQTNGLPQKGVSITEKIFRTSIDSNT